MKTLFIFLIALTLLGCGGVSEQEKQNIIDSTCAILKETSGNQSAFRVKELNSARSSIDETPFVDGDEIIQDSIRLGLCESLVSNSPDFIKQFETIKSAIVDSACAELKKIDDIYSVQEYETWSEFEIDNKISIINRARGTLNLSKYMGDSKNIALYQVLGVCEALIMNKDEPKLITNLHSIESEFSDIDSDIIFISNSGEYLIQKQFKNESGITYFSYIDIETMKNVGAVKFKGIFNMILHDGLVIKTIVDDTNLTSPFSGKSLSYYLNGKQQSELNYLDGKENGAHKWWSPEGILTTNVNFINGVREGVGIVDGDNVCYSNGKELDMEHCQ